MKSEAIARKIKAMLATANDAGASENERELALRMVQGMLIKHNLDMKDILTPEEGRENAASIQFGTPWARSIAHNIGKLFMCTYYVGRKVTSCKVEHHFVGLTANTVTAILMSEWVINLVKKEGAKMYGGDTTPGARAFGIGAAARIHQRIEKMLEVESAVEASSCTEVAIVALYKQEQAQNEAFLASTGNKLVSKKKRTKPVSAKAFYRGVDFGDKVQLNTQVGGTVAKKLT